VFAVEPPPSPGDLRFGLFGIPVRVHPLFWLVALFLGARSPDLKWALIWIAALFVAILFHELGHAVAARVFGFQPRITLYALGGLTSYNPMPVFGRRRPGPWGEILISLAGPGAGFLLAGAVIGVLALTSGHVVRIEFGGTYGIDIGGIRVQSPMLGLFLLQLLMVCIFWGAINLLPIFPLDGGQVARELFVLANPRDGLRQSLILSLVTAAAVAVLGALRLQDVFIAVFFGYLAFTSYAALQRGVW